MARSIGKYWENCSCVPLPWCCRFLPSEIQSISRSENWVRSEIWVRDWNFFIRVTALSLLIINLLFWLYRLSSILVGWPYVLPLEPPLYLSVGPFLFTTLMLPFIIIAPVVSDSSALPPCPYKPKVPWIPLLSVSSAVNSFSYCHLWPLEDRHHWTSL